MPLIPFPNVPVLPGVPLIPRSPNLLSVARATLGIVNSFLWQALQNNTQWGIFTPEGQPLVDTNFFGSVLGIGQTLSTSSVSYTKESKVSDFPVERGGFASYNKVETPGEATVILNFQGTESERSNFLILLDLACKSTALFSVVTPEITYIDFNIQSYNYQRVANKGANLLIVELSLKEIRQVSAQYSTSKVEEPKKASATTQVDGGKVQPKPVEQSTLKSLAKKVL